ncbi:MAG: glycosyltransferase family 4 protein [Actinomycetota bacterium]|nr:glycosyltransferase family 4 protein [Actinomycetota bacterium]
MRVALVCPYSLTKPGGVQGQVLGQARALRRQGHDARVLAPCDGPVPDDGVTALGRSIPLSANGSVAPLALDPATSVRTVRALRGGDFDVVHLHEPMCPGPTLAGLVFDHRPLVGTFHRAGPSAAYAALRPAVTVLARRLALRCAVSPEARATAERAMGGDYEVVFNGVEVERFTGVEPWPSSGPTVFFVGRHEPRKGLEVLLEARGDLPAETRVWVAGAGPQTAILKQRTAGDARVEWLGAVDDLEVASRLRGADVICAPSLHGESFGVVLLEAMAAGTPVVASDLPGYRSVALPGRHALLVPPGDPPALAAAICRVLGDAGLASQLAAAGRERAGEMSMGQLAERYLSLYEKVLAQR